MPYRFAPMIDRAFVNGLGFGYTLATGRLFCDFAKFHEWAEKLIERPILTHEFAVDAIWAELREAFEVWVEQNTERKP